MDYLKPNFSLHWGNWILAPLVAFFLGFLPVSAFATGFDTWTEGYYWAQNSGTPYAKRGATPRLACENLFNLYYTGHVEISGPVATDTYKCDRYDTQGQWAGTWNVGKYADCPQGSADPWCQNPFPPVECPAAGTEYKTFFNETVEDGSVVNVGSGNNVEGCEVVPVWESTQCGTPEVPQAGLECLRIISYQYTGQEKTDGDAPEDVPENRDPDVSTWEPLSDGDQTQDTKTVVPLAETEETMPDGTVVTQTGYVETETKNLGANVTQGTETTVYLWSNGITKTVTVTETTTTNPDGSKSVVRTENVTYEQTDKELTVVDNGTGGLVVTNTPGYSGGRTTTTTTNYDTEGNSTGSSTVSQNDGTGSGDVAQDSFEDQGYCEQNPQALECETVSVSGNKGIGTESWWTSGYPGGISGIWDAHTGSLESLVGTSGIADLGISSQGGDADFGCFDLSEFGLGSQCVSVASYIWQFIALCLMITAVFTSRGLVFGG